MTMSIIKFKTSTIRLMVLCSSYLENCDFFLICRSTDSSQTSGHTSVLYIVQHRCTHLFNCADCFPHFSWDSIYSFRLAICWMAYVLLKLFPFLRLRDLIYQYPLIPVLRWTDLVSQPWRIVLSPSFFKLFWISQQISFITWHAFLFLAHRSPWQGSLTIAYSRTHLLLSSYSVSLHCLSHH